MSRIGEIAFQSASAEGWFESLLIDLSSRLMGLPAGAVDSIVVELQDKLCRYLDLDSSMLWQRGSRAAGELELTHAYQLGVLKLEQKPGDGLDAASFFPWIWQHIQRGEQVVVSSLEQLPWDAAGDREALRSCGIQSIVVIPLRIAQELLGILTFAAMQETRKWPPSVVRRLELVAHLLANALARKQAAQSLKEAGSASDEASRVAEVAQQNEAEWAAQELCGRLIKSQDEHRARLARELHDDVTQRLAQIALDIARFTHQASLSEAEEKLMRGAGDALVRLSRDVHALSYNLHPSLLIEMGLEEALNAECEKFSQKKSIAVEVRLRELPGTIVRDKAVAIFRIVQEALNNSARHGRASSIEVVLRGFSGGLELTIRDNGVGFDPSRRRSTPSLGLASMRERARMQNGTFAVESEAGRGTLITAWMPN